MGVTAFELSPRFKLKENGTLKKPLFLLMTMVIWTTPLVAAPLTDKVFAAWLGEIEYLEKICGTIQVSDAAKTEMLDETNIAMADIDQGGDLYSYYVSGSINASDRFFGVSVSDICYYLKNALGEQGYLASGIALPE